MAVRRRTLIIWLARFFFSSADFAAIMRHGLFQSPIMRRRLACRAMRRLPHAEDALTLARLRSTRHVRRPFRATSILAARAAAWKRQLLQQKTADSSPGWPWEPEKCPSGEEWPVGITAYP